MPADPLLKRIVSVVSMLIVPIEMLPEESRVNEPTTCCVVCELSVMSTLADRKLEPEKAAASEVLFS